jgi:hypothetical protein
MFNNNNNKLVFNKLIEEIQGTFLERVISKYNGDFRSQHFDTKSHLYALLYSNFMNCKSLRELQTQISHNNKLKRIINIPSVSQFSRKNASRDSRIFEDIFYYLISKAKSRFGEYKLIKDFTPLRIIDSSVIVTALKLAPSLKFDDEKSVMKISTMFNGEYPEHINIVKGNINDRKCVDNMFRDKDCIYVFDRGYYDYRWYDQLTESGFKFVTRGVKNSIVMEEKFLDSNINKDIYDTEVIMGSTPGGNLTFNKYREIMCFYDNDEVITFITNIFDLSKEDIINIYKKRWEIELFFKWIKQNLRIKKFIGYNENAVRIQIFSALITYMLIYLFCKKQHSKVKYSILIVTRIIRSNLLEIYYRGIINLSG